MPRARKQPPKIATLNISLPTELKSFIEEQAPLRGCASASEFIRMLIRDHREAFRRPATSDVPVAGSLLRDGGDAVADRWRDVVDLLRFTQQVAEQNYRRRNPEASTQDVDAAMAADTASATRSEEVPGYIVAAPDRLRRLLRNPGP